MRISLCPKFVDLPGFFLVTDGVEIIVGFNRKPFPFALPLAQVERSL
jgi:hypothetical protein